MALTHRFDRTIMERDQKVRKALLADIKLTIGLGTDMEASGVITFAMLSQSTKDEYQTLKTMIDNLGA
jgi:hypothetical protein